MLCIKNGRIHDLVKEEPYVADILVKDGKIAAIGEHCISIAAPPRNSF